MLSFVISDVKESLFHEVLGPLTPATETMKTLRGGKEAIQL